MKNFKTLEKIGNVATILMLIFAVLFLAFRFGQKSAVKNAELIGSNDMGYVIEYHDLGEQHYYEW